MATDSCYENFDESDDFFDEFGILFDELNRIDDICIQLILISKKTPYCMYTIVDIEWNTDKPKTPPFVKIIGKYCLVSAFLTFGISSCYYPNTYIRYDGDPDMKEKLDKLISISRDHRVLIDIIPI